LEFSNQPAKLLSTFQIEKMTIEVGYWNIRGLVGGIRVLLEYCGEDWNEKFYEAHKTENGWDRSEWTDVKATEEFQKTFAFPNLPYMKDGEVALSQSTSILKVSIN
jgi:glutathione S-transferase